MKYKYDSGNIDCPKHGWATVQYMGKYNNNEQAKSVYVCNRCYDEYLIQQCYLNHCTMIQGELPLIPNKIKGSVERLGLI